MMVLNLYILKKRCGEMILHYNVYTRSDFSMDFVLVSLHLQFSLSDLKEKSPWGIIKQNKMAKTLFVWYPIRLLSYVLHCAAWGDDSELYCADPHRIENGQSRERLPASWARHPAWPTHAKQAGGEAPARTSSPMGWGEGRERRWSICDGYRLLVSWRGLWSRGAYTFLFFPSHRPMETIPGSLHELFK